MLTSMWRWVPGAWGFVGWTNPTHRASMLRRMTDPFLCVCYVTRHRRADPALRGRLAGFYVASHERVDRDVCTDPAYHGLEPERWRYGVRALRAFTFRPAGRVVALDWDPTLGPRAQHVAGHGVVVRDLRRLAELRALPHDEVPVYTPGR